MEWDLRDGEFRLAVTVPPNMVANIRVPTDDTSAVTANEKDGLERVDDAPGFACFRAVSGRYSFTAPKS